MDRLVPVLLLVLVFVLLLGLMGIASVTTFFAKGNAYVALAVAWTAAFLGYGRVVEHLSWADMGMTRWLHGIVWGGACILIVSIGMALGVAIPRLRPLFADERLSSASASQIAHKTLVEVPLGTVLLEEVIFRGVLMGLLTTMYGTVWGIVGSSIVFGFWHILPALEMHGNHALTAGDSSWWGKVRTVALTVLGTSLAGIVFALLRWGSGCILAPMGYHWATNSTGSIATWLIGQRANGGPEADAEKDAS